MTTEKIRTFCRVCEPACGLIASVEGEQLIKLEADRAHPISEGFVCNKGIYGADIHNDPDRLRYPLRRRADGEFERIDWDMALTEIATRLRQLIDSRGPAAVATYTGNPTAFNSLYGPSFGQFVGQLGLYKHFSSGTQDCANKFAGAEAVFGTRTLHPLPDLDHSDFILIIGENPAVSHMSFMSLPHPMKHLKAAVARGARVLYLNPREIESASIAGEVLKIRPDTDVYLLAALLHEIDHGPGFREQASAGGGRGLDELRDFVAQYPAERVAGITGIPADRIRQLALDFAGARSACAHMSTGVNMGRQGTLAYWLLQMLVYVTGNLGRRGGNFYSMGFYERASAAGRRAPPGYLDTPFGSVRKPGGVGISLPGNLLPDYLSDPADPVSALFVNSGNPVLSIGGEDRMRQALAQLELVVCVDIYRNATAEYAHYLLPAAGAYEREDVNITGLGLQYRPSIQFTPAVVPPAFERKPDWWIYEKLAAAMGLRSAFDQAEQPDMWQRVDAMLRSRGHSMAELRDQQIIAFQQSEPEELFERHVQQEDGLIDCFPEAFAAARQRMAQLFAELHSEPPDTLKLITRRDGYMMNSWYGNLPKLRNSRRDTNYLYVHPDDAERRQIRDGDRVRLSNQYGAIETAVRLDAGLMPGVVAMTHGWGQRDSRGMSVASAYPGSNCNALLPSGPGSYEPLSNQAHMTGISVALSRAV